MYRLEHSLVQVNVRMELQAEPGIRKAINSISSVLFFAFMFKVLFHESQYCRLFLFM